MSRFKIFLFGIFLFSNSVVRSQVGAKADSISILCQKWKIQELYRHSFSAGEKAELDDFIRTTTMEFSEDGSFTTKMDTVQLKGKWELEGNTLRVRMDEGNSFQMKIVFLSSSTMNFESRVDQSDRIKSAGVLITVRNKYPNL